jgi:hypothetical protein
LRNISELWQLISEKGEDDMALDLSPQQIKEMGKMWGDVILPTLPIEKRLAGINSTEVMNYFKPEERLVGMKPEERFAGMSIEEIEAYLEQKKQS